MIHLECVQGSEAWFRARIGIPTASQFFRILTPKNLRLSAQAVEYKNRLLAEWALNTPFENEVRVWQMDVGLEREQEAVDFYELTTGIETTPVGLCLTDNKEVGASPDRFAGREGLLEVKCPEAATQVGYLMSHTLPDDYMIQAQGQLWVTQRRWLDWLSYYPGLSAVLIRVLPDPRYQDALATALADFCLQLDHAKRCLKGKMP